MSKGKRYHGVHRYLKLPEHRWQMTSSELLAELEKAGLPVKPGHHIPRDLGAFATVQGIRIHVRPKTQWGMEKRVYAVCPECNEEVEAGHLHQHVEARHPAD